MCISLFELILSCSTEQMGWRGYNFIYKCKNWLKERWTLYWLKHLCYYLVGFMSDSSWKVVSITGNMIWKGQTEALERCDLWNCSSLNKRCRVETVTNLWAVKLITMTHNLNLRSDLRNIINSCSNAKILVRPSSTPRSWAFLSVSTFPTVFHAS